MSSVPQDRRYAPPAAHVEDVAAEGEMELAGRGARLLAFLVDIIVVGIVGGLAASLLIPHGVELVSTGAMSVLRFLAYQFTISFGTVLLITGYPLATRGQTPGKMLMRIRIVRSDGSRAGFARLFLLRYVANAMILVIPLFGVLYALADWLCIFRESRKCLHDNLADTIVVKV